MSELMFLSGTIYIYEYFVFLHCMCTLQSSLTAAILLIKEYVKNYVLRFSKFAVAVDPFI